MPVGRLEGFCVGIQKDDVQSTWKKAPRGLLALRAVQRSRSLGGALGIPGLRGVCVRVCVLLCSCGWCATRTR